MPELVAFCALSAACAVALAFLTHRFIPTLNDRRVRLYAALPLSLLVVAAGAFTIFDAATATREKCGVDASGMTMMFSVILIGYALIAFAIAACTAFLFVKLQAR